MYCDPSVTHLYDGHFLPSKTTPYRRRRTCSLSSGTRCSRCSPVEEGVWKRRGKENRKGVEQESEQEPKKKSNKSRTRSRTRAKKEVEKKSHRCEYPPVPSPVITSNHNVVVVFVPHCRPAWRRPGWRRTRCRGARCPRQCGAWTGRPLVGSRGW